ncbi:ABC transporter ATP-binding protein [Aquirufa antheringensis]|uniref:ABC transporter ATP-binding protein n=1 Tax=Aquirufa antheringensis TaxID=2516559 RepID=A0A4Q9BBK4_9BACT|nr:ABC transporter ATP-binding protein [Aquirufa antheringensis]MCZ2486015.1 ABC transporter ATP-binding protein [Aquirufa antheringensis]TBH73206.1 ABC transporter ATP-binding protein [Aquirufa antheringensis]
MLELKNISKSYGTQLILDNISLQVKESEMVSILGPSGSGKSTLLQIMGLLMKADAGQIYLDGIDYAALSEKDQANFRNQKLGFVFQFHHLLGEFTCEENIKFPLFIKGSKLDEADLELFDKIVQTLGIQPILHKLPSQISGGEQQRVAVARALINRPTLLLADEPTGNLDNKNAETLYALFVELKAVWQQRIIMVTHNEKLTYLSDQVIYLNSGRIE